jgi:hypothetical protein
LETKKICILGKKLSSNLPFLICKKSIEHGLKASQTMGEKGLEIVVAGDDRDIESFFQEVRNLEDLTGIEIAPPEDFSGLVRWELGPSLMRKNHFEATPSVVYMYDEMDFPSTTLNHKKPEEQPDVEED